MVDKDKFSSCIVAPKEYSYKLQETVDMSTLEVGDVVKINDQKRWTVKAVTGWYDSYFLVTLRPNSNGKIVFSSYTFNSTGKAQKPFSNVQITEIIKPSALLSLKERIEKLNKAFLKLEKSPSKKEVKWVDDMPLGYFWNNQFQKHLFTNGRRSGKSHYLEKDLEEFKNNFKMDKKTFEKTYTCNFESKEDERRFMDRQLDLSSCLKGFERKELKLPEGEVAVKYCDPPDFTILSKNLDLRVRVEVARKTNTPKEGLAELSKDISGWVRATVAENPNTPKEALIELSKDSNSWVRATVAGNPNTPTETLIELSQDSNSDVRASVARNLNIPTETLTELSKDSSGWVRAYVAENPNTPIETLIELSKDCEGWVKETATRNPNTSWQIVRRSLRPTEKILPPYPTKPKPEVIKLSGKPIWHTRGLKDND